MAPTAVEPSVQLDEGDTAVSRASVDDDDSKGTLPGPRSEPPSLLAGRYDLRSFLGGGAMGTVHLAIDRTLGRPVAVKLIREARALESQPRARFLREAQALATLSHPAIVPLLDFGVEDEFGLCFTVLRYIEGPSLKTYLEQHGPIDEHTACVMLEILASALAHAHQAGILHRDLKPENVLLEVDPMGRMEPRLTDFGLAKIENAQPITAVGVRLGTPTSMAPEQVMGGRLDARADLYALGCLIDWLVVGRPPFTEVDAFALYEAHVARPPPSLPERLVDGRPPSEGLKALRASLLAKAKEDRPLDAFEVVRRLQVILRPQRRPRRVVSWMILAGTLAAAALALVGFFGARPSVPSAQPVVVEPPVSPVIVRPVEPRVAPPAVADPPPTPRVPVPRRRTSTAPPAAPSPVEKPPRAPEPPVSPPQEPLMPLW
jgi:serine/threonine protein kinase